MNSSKINIGIIGLGRMGITHFSIINSHPEVKINSIADTSGPTLSLLKKYIPEVAVFNDYKKLMDEAKPNGIIICTPSNLHYPVIQYAFNKGIHVFVEKPFTANINEARELTELFEKSSLINQVGYVIRFNDVFQKVRFYLEQGLIGKIANFHVEMLSCAVVSSNEGAGWRATRSNGGGATFESASHAIDMINYLIGTPEKIAGTSMVSLFSKNVEDIVNTSLFYENGIAGTLYINWSDESYRKPTLKFEIFGSKGKIVADMFGCKIFLNKADENFNFRKGWNTIYITDVFKPVEFYVRGNEFTRQLYLFADQILGKKVQNISTFRDALQTQIVIDKMFKDAKFSSVL